MAGFYEVNPGNASEIFPRDLNGKRYQEGASGLSTRYGVAPTTLGPEAAPSLNIYQSTPATNPAPEPGSQYYESTILTVFSGTVNDPAARVVESFDWSQIPIDELYRQKQRELANYEEQVTYSAIEAGDPSWAWVLNAAQRLKITSVNEGLQDRLKDIVIDGDVKPYWPDGFTTNIIRQNKAYGSQKQFEVTSDLGATGWGSLMKKKFQHDEAKDKASWLCGQDIDAAYDANGGGWDALAIIDVQDAAYGWPPWWAVTSF